MRGVRVGLALALAGIGAAALPATAATSKTALVVTSTVNSQRYVSFVDFSITRPVRIDVSAWTATGPATYTGFFLTNRNGRRVQLGSIDVKGFHATGYEPGRLPMGDYLASPDTKVWTLAAGLYRLYVLSDDDVRLTLPTPGTATRSLTARKTTDGLSMQGNMTATPTAAGGLPAAMWVDWPMIAAKQSVGIVGMRVIADRAAITDAYVTDICFINGPNERTCPQDDSGEHYNFEETHTGAFGLGSQVSHLDLAYYAPGKVPVGLPRRISQRPVRRWFDARSGSPSRSPSRLV